MSLSGARSQNFFATAIFVSAVMLCWSAEAAPKNFGYNQIVRNASPDITTQIGRSDPDTVTCYVFNKSYENICVVYDVYPSGHSLTQHVERYHSLFREKPGAALLGRSLPTAINAVQACFHKVHTLARSVSVTPHEGRLKRSPPCPLLAQSGRDLSLSNLIDIAGLIRSLHLRGRTMWMIQKEWS